MYSAFPVPALRRTAEPEKLAHAFAANLLALNVTRLFLAVSASPFYMQFAEVLQSYECFSFPQVVYLKESLTMQEMEQFVGRVLKPSGVLAIALFVDEETGLWLPICLERYHLTIADYVFFLSDEAAWSARNGEVYYVTETAAAAATNRLEHEALILRDRIPGSNITSISLSLIHLQAGIPTPISPSSTLFFPPISLLPVIEVSADFTALNYDGSRFPYIDITTRGISVAYSEANRRKDFLPNFQFVNNSVNFGGSKYNETWAIAQIRKSGDRIGVAFHAFGFSNVIVPLNRLFTSINMTVPMTAIATSSMLSDPVEFPMFVRALSSVKVNVSVMIRFARLFNWRKVAIIYSDSITDKDFYSNFRNISAGNDIIITNSERLRCLPQNLTEAQSQLNETVLDILNSRTRIIISAHLSTHIIAERLYDFGARSGDYMLFITMGLSNTLYGGSDAASIKRRTVIKGAMMVSDRYFSGAEGPRVRDLLRERVGEKYDPVSCVHYDNAMLVAHSVDYMLVRGRHYEHGLELIKAMRTTRFHGCGGIIQIEPGSNDRRPGDYSVLNAHINETTGALELVEAAIYSPLKMQLFTLLPALQFPDGNNISFPDTWLSDPNCPYLSRDIHEFPPGKALTLAICCLYFGLVIAIFSLIWLKASLPPPEMLIRPVVMSFEDGFFELLFLMESLQFLVLLPTLPLPSFLTDLINLISLNLTATVSFSHGVFWALLSILMAVIVVCMLVGYIRKYQPNSALVHIICSVMSGPGLLPVSTTLLNTFICDKAIGSSYSSSILARDCYYTCWSGTHLGFAISAFIFLVVFTLFVAWTRINQQNSHSDLHLKAYSAHITAHTVLQTSLIAGSVALKPFPPLYYSVLYCAGMSGMAMFTCIRKGFNYERVNLWYKLVTFVGSSYGIMGLFALQYSTTSHFYWQITAAGEGLALIILLITAQICVKKYKSLLLRVQDDRYDMIKFAFTCGKRAKQHLRTFQSKRSSFYNAVHRDIRLGPVAEAIRPEQVQVSVN